MKKKQRQNSRATPPPIPDKITYPFYDEPWWLEYSRWVRASKGWQCDECGIVLKDNHEMLHTHHVNGINQNTIRDLQALCIGCHAEQPSGNHRQLKKRRTYKRFMEKYGDTWRRRCEKMCHEI